MTTISVHKEKPLSSVTSSGSWSGNTVAQRGLLQQVVIKPTTDTTMYDFSLTDVNNDIVYNRTDVSGTLNEEVNIPLRGVYTMSISNATKDEAFDIILVVRER